jgi:hypothetical protein
MSEPTEPRNVLTFVNDGPLLVATDYWQSETAAAGKLYVSINAGCFRLLVPKSQHAVISDMRPKAKHIVVSMLPRDKWVDREYCLEWMVEDGSNTPWACHLSPGAVDRAPNHEDVGKEWRGRRLGPSKRSPPQMLGTPSLLPNRPRIALAPQNY